MFFETGSSLNKAFGINHNHPQTSDRAEAEAIAIPILAFEADVHIRTDNKWCYTSLQAFVEAARSYTQNPNNQVPLPTTHADVWNLVWNSGTSE